MSTAPRPSKPKRASPVSLATPGVRMVVVAAFATTDPEGNGWKVETEILPVVALAASIDEDGGVEYHPLILYPDPALGITPVDALGVYNVVHHLATARWPAEQD